MVVNGIATAIGGDSKDRGRVLHDAVGVDHKGIGRCQSVLNLRLQKVDNC